MPSRDAGFCYRVGNRRFDRVGVLDPDALERVCCQAEILMGGSEHEREQLWNHQRQHLGHDLFTLLLGERPNWGPLVRALFNESDGHLSQSSPTARPVHVHIVTRDRFWSHLPWRLTRYQHHVLAIHGWQFVVTTSELPGAHVRIPSPAHVLLVGSHPDIAKAPDAHQPDHLDAVREFLVRLWSLPEDTMCIETVYTRDQLKQRLQARTPALLYIYAPTRVHQGAPSLLLDDGTSMHTPVLLPMTALAEMLASASTRPSVVYVNTGSHSPDHTLVAQPHDAPLSDLDVPLILWRYLPHRTPASTEMALNWMKIWLMEARDPVDAVRKYAVRGQDLRSLEAASLAIRARYASWTTAPPRHPQRTGSPLLLVDRDQAKAIVVKHILDLAEIRSRRVMTTVAYAKPLNRIDQLWKQLQHEIRHRCEPEVMVEHQKLQLPLSFHQPYDGDDSRKFFRAHLERALRAQMGGYPNESLQTILQRHAPETRGRAKRVLWLDWGTCGEGLEQPALIGYHLEAWVFFAAEVLTRECDNNLRVLSYLAMETSNPEGVSDLLGDLLDELSSVEQFTLDRIEIGGVDKIHLLNYLRDYTDCPAGVRAELAKSILRITRDESKSSNFDSIVTWLDKAASGGSWYDLRDQLRTRLHGKPRSKDTYL